MSGIYAQLDGKVVSIMRVVSGHIASSSDFRCPKCQIPMLPVMGAVRRPHFRHRDLSDPAAGSCTPEGLLHATAKAVIAPQIASAVVQGRPYLLTMAARIACPERSQFLLGTCRHRSEIRSVDLSGLGSPQLEAQRGPFRYDLLFKPESRHPLAVEVAVTSPAPPEKRSAGVPVVEIRIQSEEDIMRLADGISDTALNVAGFCLEAHLGAPLTACAKTGCASRCLAFNVMRSGRVRLEELPVFESMKPTPGSMYRKLYVSETAFALSRFEALDRLARHAFFVEQAPVRSCLVCRHHQIADFMNEGDGPIVCAVDRKKGSVNRASDCLYFTPFSTISEARQHRLTSLDVSVLEDDGSL